MLFCLPLLMEFYCYYNCNCPIIMIFGWKVWVWVENLFKKKKLRFVSRKSLSKNFFVLLVLVLVLVLVFFILFKILIMRNLYFCFIKFEKYWLNFLLWCFYRIFFSCFIAFNCFFIFYYLFFCHCNFVFFFYFL